MSRIELRIAIWGGKKSAWGKKFLGNATGEQRLARLAEVVAFSRTNWLDLGQNSTLPVLKIFVAPESMLVKSEDERAFAFDDLKWKSTRFTEAFVELSQGLLFIPGTAIWKKPMVKGASATEDSLQPVKEKQALAMTEYRERHVNYYKEQGYGESGQQATADIHLKRLQKKFTTIQQQWSPSSQDIYIARNVAYVYLNGSKVMKYYKLGEDRLGKKTQEIQPKDKEAHKDIKFIPGTEEGAFNVDLGTTGTLHCGLEICVDHTSGYLKFSQGGKNVHLQFLLSDVTHLKKDKMSVRPGGYLVHAATVSTTDMDMGLTGLYDHEGKGITPQAWHSLVDSELLFHTVELTV